MKHIMNVMKHIKNVYCGEKIMLYFLAVILWHYIDWKALKENCPKMQSSQKIIKVS